MGWAALPVAGGLYDQHPQLLREWQIIFAEKAKFEKEQQAKRDAEMKRKSKSGK